MPTISNLFTDLKDKIVADSEINILVDEITIRFFYEISNQVNLSKKINIIINNKEFLKKIISNNCHNLFSNDDEIPKQHDFIDPIIASGLIKLIGRKIFFKSLEEKSSNYKFSMLLIDKNNVVYHGVNSLSLSSLGLVKSNNRELIRRTDDKQTYDELYTTYKEIWFAEGVVDVNRQIIDQLEKVFYPKSLINLYNYSISKIFENSSLDKLEGKDEDIKTWKKSKTYQSLYNFQRNAVHGIIDKIQKYNGCILADSVGLGKTWEALAVIKYFEFQRKEVLVLVPKKLRNNWEVYVQKNQSNALREDSYKFTIMCHTDLGRKKGKSGNEEIRGFDWGCFDLVVIDESHNFRNYSYTDDEGKSKSRYQLLLENVIKGGRKTNVLLLSATPVNNRMQDIENQIKFITSDNDSAFQDIGLKSIHNICMKAENQSEKWSNLPASERTTSAFTSMIGSDFRKLMDAISIARSRKHIKETYDQKDLSFPKRLKTLNHKSEIDTENDVLSIKEFNNLFSKSILSMYKPHSYIRPQYESEYKHKIANFNSKDREESLVAIIKISLLKRFESSIFSFKKSLNNMIERANSFLNSLNKHILQSENELFNISGNDEFLEEIEEETSINWSKNNINFDHLDIIKYKRDLEYDLTILNQLKDSYYSIDDKRDKKLMDLKKIIDDKISNPINQDNRKVLMFSSYSDTAEYLYDELKKYYEYKNPTIKLGLITGKKCCSSYKDIYEMDDILTYFSPISKNRNLKNLDENINIDILIGTDCISEGQNLQDCDYLINYDIHWNPVRLIQRFGRIDRIGSKNEFIQMVNIWPEIELEEYIKLESKIRTKMQKVTHASTDDENILNDDQYINLEDSYRYDQLKKMTSDELNDLDDIKGEVTFSSLALNDYLMDLKILLDDNKLVQYPSWVYSIINKDKIGLEKPGIIFVLKNNTIKNDDNQLEKYYLVFIEDDGNIKYGYKDTYKILSILKKASLYTAEITNINYSNLKNKITNLFDKVMLDFEEENKQNNFDSLFDQNSLMDNVKYKFEIISLLLITN